MPFLERLRSALRARRAPRPKSSPRRFRPGLEALEGRELPAVALPIHLDFDTTASPVASGYQSVRVAPYSASQGFGWQSITGIAHMDRGGTDLLDRDFHYGKDGTFLVDLPNGLYDVTLDVGDPKMKQNDVDVWAEGQQVASRLTADLGVTLRPTFRVQVNDGQLTLHLVDQGGSNPNFALAGLDVVPVPRVAPVTTVLGGPVSGHSPEGSPLSLLASVVDPDSPTGFTYAWSVTRNGSPFATSSAASFDFTPTDDGVYALQLIVTDSTGLPSTASNLSITVDNVAPTVSLGGPYGGVAGSAIAFGATAADPSSVDTQAGFSYLWSFGDGTTSTLANPGHVYSSAGTYTVTGQVTDRNGGSTSVGATVTVDALQSYPSISGVWSLGIPDKDPLAAVYTNASVDGIALRTEWNMIEKTNGTYDWSYLDRTIAAAAAAGKKVSLSVAAGADAPSWLYTIGAKSFIFTANGVTEKLPVPWDAVFVSQWTEFVQALGARYATNPAVVLVKITGINATTPETMLPRTSADNANWVAAGYTPQKVESAWLTIADAFAQAFPRQQVSLITVPSSFPPIDATGKITTKSGDDVLARALIADGISRYGRHFTVENHGLSTFWVAGTVQTAAAQVNTGYQTLWNVTNDTTYRMTQGQTPYNPSDVLLNAVNKGIAANARFIEIYQADVINSSLSSVLAYAHNNLVNLAPMASITGAPVSSPVGTAITLGRTVSDANAVDVATGFLQQWTVTKNGTAYASGTGATFSFTPDANGTYVVSLIVTDRDGKSSAVVTKAITV